MKKKTYKYEKQYIINLTTEQHHLFKTRAAMMGLSIKELIILAVYELVEGGKANGKV